MKNLLIYIHKSINRFFDKHIENQFINTMFTTHIGRIIFFSILFVIGLFTIGQYQEHEYVIDIWYYLAVLFASTAFFFMMIYCIIIFYNAIKNLIKR